MSLIVVDASVAAKFVLTESDSAIALAVFHGPDRLVAPTNIKYEVIGAVLRRFRSGTMEEEPARAACDDWHAILSNSSIDLVRTEELYDSALQIAFKIKHTLADCQYIAAAKMLDCPLLTADSTLLERGRRVHSRISLLGKAA